MSGARLHPTCPECCCGGYHADHCPENPGDEPQPRTRAEERAARAAAAAVDAFEMEATP